MGLIKPVLFCTLPNRITVYLIQLYTMHVLVLLYTQRRGKKRQREERREKREEKAKVVTAV